MEHEVVRRRDQSYWAKFESVTRCYLEEYDIYIGQSSCYRRGLTEQTGIIKVGTESNKDCSLKKLVLETDNKYYWWTKGRNKTSARSNRRGWKWINKSE